MYLIKSLLTGRAAFTAIIGIVLMTFVFAVPAARAQYGTEEGTSVVSPYDYYQYDEEPVYSDGYSDTYIGPPPSRRDMGDSWSGGGDISRGEYQNYNYEYWYEDPSDLVE